VKVVNLVFARTKLFQNRNVLASAPHGVDGNFEFVGLVEELGKLRERETISEETVLDGLLGRGAGDLSLDGFV
jgi:hypothetical protein